MSRIYGSIGECAGPCGRRNVRLHGYVKLGIFCMRCYSAWRRLNPVTLAKQQAAARRYRIRNKDRIDKYNVQYIVKRYAADPLFRTRIIENVKTQRHGKRKLQRRRAAGAESEGADSASTRKDVVVHAA